MALTKPDRISISRKIAEAPFKMDSLTRAQQGIQSELERAQADDSAHKRLTDDISVLVDGYENELAQLDGNVRAQITESDYINSANRAPGNFFYPRDLGSLPPSISPNIWILTKPYARTKAVGFNMQEVFPATTTKEEDVQSLVDAAIASIESLYLPIERTTGERCSTNGTCSLEQYLNQSSCTGNGGSWTMGSDDIFPSVQIQNALTDLVNKVTDLRDFLVAEQAFIVSSDPDPTRQSQNSVANDSIEDTLDAIDIWLGLVDFNNAHGQTTCAAFYAYNPNLLGPTKLRPTELDALKLSLSNRAAYRPTRQSELTTNLGGLSQNLSTGSVTGSGLYLERWRYISLRLNLLGGSLIEYLGLQRAVLTQEEQKENLEEALEVYQGLLACASFVAPANGTRFINVKDGSLFAANDFVYIKSETQEEISRSVVSVTGNRIELSIEIPAKYRESDLARIYKDLT